MPTRIAQTHSTPGDRRLALARLTTWAGSPATTAFFSLVFCNEIMSSWSSYSGPLSWDGAGSITITICDSARKNVGEFLRMTTPSCPKSLRKKHSEPTTPPTCKYVWTLFPVVRSWPNIRAQGRLIYQSNHHGKPALIIRGCSPNTYAISVTTRDCPSNTVRSGCTCIYEHVLDGQGIRVYQAK